MIRVDGEKMSKSLKNFHTIRDVLESYRGEEVRMFLLASHYRSPVNFSDDSMQTAREVLRRFYTALRAREQDAETDVHSDYLQRFEAAMDDDLNTPEALAVMHELAGDLNRCADAAKDGSQDESRRAEVARLARTLSYLGGRLGILQDSPEEVLQGDHVGSGMQAEEIDALIAERKAARENKDWARGDEIRDALLEAGVVLEDRDGNTTWRRQ